MLETLGSIDWAHIHHSHGTAEEFPRWIRELRSDDAEVRKAAQENLFEFSHHQGSIYEVTSYVVPFMIELLDLPDTPDRADILHFLASLAHGSEGMARVSRFGGNEETTFENVTAGMDIYLALLDDPAPDVRLAAFRAVTSLRRSTQAGKATDPLIGAASREPDAGTLAEMIQLLQVHEQSDAFWGLPGAVPGTRKKKVETLLGFVASLLASERLPRVRFRAALAQLALVGEARRETAEDIAAILRDVLVHPETYCLGATSFSVEWEMKQALEGLEIFPRARRLAILAEALGAARYVGDAHLIGRALLETLFYGAIRPDRPDRAWVDSHEPHAFIGRTRLTEADPAERPDNSRAPFRENSFGKGQDPRQIGWRYAGSPPPADLGAMPAEDRRLLRLVLDTDLVWMVHSNLLKVYGLPVERGEARALLDAADAGEQMPPGT